MKNVYKLITICLTMMFSKSLYAQTGKLKGTVTDSSNKPVELANVIIENTKLTTVTDAKGYYLIENIPVGSYSVILSVMGNKPVVNKINIKENETAVLNITLNQKVHPLKEVTVTGTISANGMGHLPEVHDGVIYSGMKTEVLVLDSIDANTAQDNPREVLGRIPGSTYSETEGGGFPSNGIALRGLRPTQSIEIQTRQNGYGIAADLYGYPETYYMPPLEGLQRIEVIRGESSLQYGPQFGGVINFVTKDGPEDKPFEFTTAQTGASYNFFNSFNSIGGTYKKWHYFAYAQYKAQTGYRPNADVSQIEGFAKIEYKASDKFKVGLEYSLLRNRIHMAGGLDDAEFKANPDTSVRSRNWLRSPWNILVLTAEFKPSENTLFTFKSAMNSSARDLVWRNEDGGIFKADSINPATLTYQPREVEHEGFLSISNELRLLTYYKLGGVEQTLAAGVRYFNGYMKREEGGIGSTGSDFDLNLISGNFANDLDFYTTNIAPFIENTFHIGQRILVTPGFRFEYIRSTANGYATDDSTSVIYPVNIKQYWNIPLGGLSVQYKTSAMTDIYANIAQAYEPTSYANLTPFGSTGQIDPNLKDVSGYNSDIGWRGAIKDIINFDVGVFYMTFNDEIGTSLRYHVINNDTTYYTYTTNLGDAVHKGVETYIEFNPFKKYAYKSKIGTISFFNSYSYIEATYVTGQYKGNLEEFAPKNIDRFGVNYSLKGFLSVTFVVSSSSRSFADAANTPFSPDATVGLIPSYTVLDLSGVIKIKNYRIKFGVSNLTDKQYFTLRTTEYPGPGIIPAQPRSIYAGFGATF